MKIHPSITLERLSKAAFDNEEGEDNPGFCVKCGECSGEVEPDATRYPCEYCGAPDSVYGIEDLAMRLL